MHLIIDGYNLLHIHRPMGPLTGEALQRERDRLIDRLSLYRRQRACEITVVFDGWQGGWTTEKRELKKGIELVFSKLGEKADEVIKRFIQKKGSGAIVVTSDREISKFADRMDVSVISSQQFMEKIETASFRPEQRGLKGEEEERGQKGKGPSRRLSKKERKRLHALKKI